MIYDPLVYAHPFTLALIRRRGQTRHQHDFLRHAVRAIVRENGRLLMVHSTSAGDYKFPGGGLHTGEKHAVALARELREEAGRSLKRIVTLLGTTIELDISPEENCTAFRMISFYYLCELAPGILPLALDEYEKALGYTPAWITLEHALKNNEQIRRQTGIEEPFWLSREIAVLHALNNILGRPDLSH